MAETGRGVAFRHRSAKILRDVLIGFAADSRQASPWARETCTSVRVPAANAIRTRYASSPEHRPGSSGAAGADHTAYDPTHHTPTTPTRAKRQRPVDRGFSVGVLVVARFWSFL
jgi:hypothetical protein